MSAATINLPIEIGTHVAVVWTLLQPDDTPVNLTGYHAWLRAGRILDCDDEEKGGLVIDYAEGRITLVQTPEQTRAWDEQGYQGIPYQLNLIPADPTQEFRLSQGRIMFSTEVPHD